MNKIFEPIQKFNAPVNIIMMSGIAFSLMSLTEVNKTSWKLASESSSTTNGYNSTRVAPKEGKAFFQLCDNLLSTRDKILYSFENSVTDACVRESLYPVCNMIAEGVSDLDVEKVSVRANADEKYVNVAMRLPHDIILSINRRDEEQLKDIVGFNIIRHRELLISDFLPIDKLDSFIRNIEDKLA